MAVPSPLGAAFSTAGRPVEPQCIESHISYFETMIPMTHTTYYNYKIPL